MSPCRPSPRAERSTYLIQLNFGVQVQNDSVRLAENLAAGIGRRSQMFQVDAADFVVDVDSFCSLLHTRINFIGNVIITLNADHRERCSCRVSVCALQSLPCQTERNTSTTCTIHTNHSYDSPYNTLSFTPYNTATCSFREY